MNEKNKITTAINILNNNVTSVNILHTKAYNQIMKVKWRNIQKKQKTLLITMFYQN